ncbi:MAG: LysE family translocator [Novosphingobium sp.]
MIASLITYSAALGIAAAIPGPGVAAVVGQSMGNELKASLFLLGGIILGDLTYLTVAIAGLAGIARTFSGAFLVVKVLGGFYLAYIAWKMWTSSDGIIQARAKGSPTGLGSFLSGYSLTLGNPKTIVFYLALLPTVLDLGAVGLAQWSALACMTALTLVVTLAPYAVLADRARSLISRPSALQRITRAAAAIIGGTSVIILGQAAREVARRT